MQVKVEDDTGNLLFVMRENAALSLSGTASKEDFEAARADEFLDSPKEASDKSFVSLRCLRHPPVLAVLISLRKFSTTSSRRPNKQ